MRRIAECAPVPDYFFKDLFGFFLKKIVGPESDMAAQSEVLVRHCGGRSKAHSLQITDFWVSV